MKSVFAALVAFFLCTHGVAKEIFTARCVPALTKGEFAWRVEDTGRGVRVRYSDPKKKFSAEIRGVDADALRAKIAHLRLSKADVTLLRSSEVSMADGRIILRPFDGVTCFFTIPPHEEIGIDNPSFDLEHHAAFEETARLREALDLLDHLTRVAKKEPEANQSLQPTAPSGRG